MATASAFSKLPEEKIKMDFIPNERRIVIPDEVYVEPGTIISWSLNVLSEQPWRAIIDIRFDGLSPFREKAFSFSIDTSKHSNEFVAGSAINKGEFKYDVKIQAVSSNDKFEDEIDPYIIVQ